MKFIGNRSLFFLAIVVLVIGMAVAGCSSSSKTTDPVATETPAPTPSNPPLSITWTSYKGDVSPDANTPAFTLYENSVPVSTPAVSNTIVSNGIMTFDTTGTSSTAASNKADWRIDKFFSAEPSKMTLLIRMKFNASGAGTATRAAEIDLNTGYNNNSGARIKFIVRGDSNKLQIEKPLNTSESTISDTNTETSEYRIYQITYNITSATAKVNVYVDGAPVSNMTDVTVNGLTSTNNCLLIGDGGSSAYCCDIDWMAWTFDGVYTPSQVAGTLPSGLGVTTGY